VWLRNADASTLALLGEQTGAHSSTVHAVAFSPDGTRIASVATDLRLWGGRAWLVLCPRLLHVAAGCSASGAGSSGLKVWLRVRTRDADASTLSLVAVQTSTYSSLLALSMCFSPDGSRIVSASGSSIRLWGGQRSLPLCAPVGSGRGKRSW
jgi:Tol biopolymer transport system component